MAIQAGTTRVGLIGLGLMGRGLGLSLLRAGRRLGMVAHRRRETAIELLKAGAWEAGSAAELAAQCEVIVLCLPSQEAAEAVLFGPASLTQGGRGGLLVIESSTLVPEVGIDFERRL